MTYELMRLHPVAVIDYIFRNIYRLAQALLPVFIILIAEEDLRGWIFLAIAAVLLAFVLYAILYWYKFVYYIRDDELRLEYGVIVHQDRSIPFERIQSIHIKAGVVQRIFGLVSFEVETAGGGKDSEVSLPALSRRQAEKLRKILESHRTVTAVEAPQKDIIIYRLSTKALLQAASTSNGIWVILLGVTAILPQIDEILPGLNIYTVIGDYAINMVHSSTITIILIIIGALALTWMLSLIGSIIKFSGFILVRENDRITISRGLLEKRQVTLPIKRIQAIIISESVLRQPFGLASIDVISTGYGETGQISSTLFPLLRRSEAEKFLGHVLPEFSTDLSIRSVPKRSLASYIAPPSLLIVLLVIAVSIYTLMGNNSLPVPYLPFLLLLLIIPAALFGYLQHRDAGYKVSEDVLIMRSRLLGRATSIIPVRKIQSLQVASTFLQKWNKLTTVRVGVASKSSAGRIIEVKGIDEDDSAYMMDWLKEKHIRNGVLFSVPEEQAPEPDAK